MFGAGGFDRTLKLAAQDRSDLMLIDLDNLYGAE